MPTGGSIGISQVEMAVGRNSYLPDAAKDQFAGKTINRLSGRGGISDHATTVAQYYFGLVSGGLMDAYEANDWSGLGFLNLNSRFEPRAEERLTQNHSWVGTFGLEDADTDALRRVDLLVQRDGVLVTTGVKNGAGTPMPRLMCSAYNVLAVGLSSGDSSFGPTRIEEPGRIKPDIVAPMSATSWATPIVAACGALLMEAIENGGHLSYMSDLERRLAKPLLTKALLMGGATKSGCPGWRRGLSAAASAWSVPLDARYGAGQLNIDNSHRILTAGQSKAEDAADVPLTGWHYAKIGGGQSRRYFIDVPETRNGATLSVLVTWHRKIIVSRGGDSASKRSPAARASANPGSSLQLTPLLADINLRLYRAVGSAPGSVVDASLSAIDNVEHVFQQGLSGGRYMIEVTSDLAWDYCITWDVQATPAVDWPRFADGTSPREPQAPRRIGALASNGTDASAHDRATPADAGAEAGPISADASIAEASSSGSLTIGSSQTGPSSRHPLP